MTMTKPRTHLPVEDVPQGEEASRLTIRLKLSLLFAGLILIMFITVGVGYFALNQVLSDAPAINISGSERMRAFKLAVLAHRHHNLTDLSERAAVIAEMQDEIERFETFLAGLRDGSAELGLRAATDAATLSHLENAKSDWLVYRGYLQDYMAATPETELQYLEPITSQSPVVAAEVDAAVNAFEAQSKANANQSRFLLLVTLVLSALAAVGAFFLVNQISRRLTQLSKTAEFLAGGDLTVQASVGTSDEIGTLAATFNRLSARLRQTLEGLEARVAEATRDLALAAEVAQSISQVRDLDTLLTNTVELIRARFDLYYAQIYLADEKKRGLTLRSGTGSVGVELVRRGHRLLIGPGSINGRAAAEKQAVVVSDTTQSRFFLPNPLLPGTKSEMAVPLMVGERVVGALNLQHTEAGAFTEENLPAFEALAGQLAIAIDNASLFDEAAKARAEVEEQARRAAHAGWQDFLDAIERRERTGYTYDQTEIQPLDKSLPETAPDGRTLEVPIRILGEQVGTLQLEGENRTWAATEAELVEAVSGQVAGQIERLRLLAEAERSRVEAEEATRRLTREGWETYLQTSTTQYLGFLYDLTQVTPLTPEALETDGSEPSLTQAITVQGEPVGELAIAGMDGLDEETTELVAAVTEQLSAHLENLRLLEETERGQAQLDKRAQELATVAQVSTTASTELDTDKLLRAVVELTQTNFSFSHVHVFLLDEPGENLELIAGTGSVGQKIVEEGMRIPLRQEQSLVARAARTREGIIANDVHQEPGFLPHPLLPNTQSEMVIPLIAGDRVLGVLDIQDNRIARFTETDATIQSTLASQVAVALQNANQYEQTQAVLAETASLYQATRALGEVFELEALVEKLADVACDLTSADYSVVATLDPETKGVEYFKHAGVDLEKYPAIKMPEGKGLLGAVLSGQAIRTADISTHPLAVGLPEWHFPLRAILGIPLFYRGEIRGLMMVGAESSQDSFDERDERILNVFAIQAITAIENSRLYEQTQERAQQEQILREVAAQVYAAPDAESILRTAAEAVSQALGLEAFAYLEIEGRG